MVANVVHELLLPPLRWTSYVTPDVPHVHERSTELMPAWFSWRVMETKALDAVVGFAVTFWVGLGVAVGFGVALALAFDFAVGSGVGHSFNAAMAAAC